VAADGAGDRVEAERAGFAAFFDFIAQHRSLYRIVRQAEFVDQALFREYYLKMADGYSAGLRAAMDRGEIASVDPEVLAYCLMGIGDFLGMRWVIWGDDAIPAHVFEAAMQFIQHGLAGPDATTREGGGTAM
jgi:AcrR family transcriptional regulator